MIIEFSFYSFQPAFQPADMLFKRFQYSVWFELDLVGFSNLKQLNLSLNLMRLNLILLYLIRLNLIRLNVVQFNLIQSSLIQLNFITIY